MKNTDQLRASGAWKWIAIVAVISIILLISATVFFVATSKSEQERALLSSLVHLSDTIDAGPSVSDLQAATIDALDKLELAERHMDVTNAEKAADVLKEAGVTVQIWRLTFHRYSPDSCKSVLLPLMVTIGLVKDQKEYLEYFRGNGFNENSVFADNEQLGHQLVTSALIHTQVDLFFLIQKMKN